MEGRKRRGLPSWANLLASLRDAYFATTPDINIDYGI